jgi:WD40-like Beta Propeller Repeat
MTFTYKTILSFLFMGTIIVAFAQQAHSGSKKFSDWSAPVNLGAIVNSTFDDNHPHISKDRLSLFFHSNRPEGYGGIDIWVSQRASEDDPWGPPQNLGPNINTSSDDRVPFLSHDGHRLYFASNRPGGLGGTDIYSSYRNHKHDDFGWELPVSLGPMINSNVDDDAANLVKSECDATVFYFASIRAGGIGDFDI